MKELVPYIRHIGNCGAKDSNDPLDPRCICGLRQSWMSLWNKLYNQNPLIKVDGM